MCSARQFMFAMLMIMSGVPTKMRAGCYPHFTCATDTDKIKKMFEDVKQAVL